MAMTLNARQQFEFARKQPWRRGNVGGAHMGGCCTW